jgi:hypothetical protein
MEKRGPYKGANKSSRGDARKGGFRKPDSRPAFDKKPAGRKPITQYPDLDKKRRIDDAERAALSRVTVLAGDEVALGCNSAGWPAFAETLRAKFQPLDKAKIPTDRIAVIWNKNGFKTGAGQSWTPRLVEVAKTKISETDATPPTGSAP